MNTEERAAAGGLWEGGENADADANGGPGADGDAHGSAPDGTAAGMAGAAGTEGNSAGDAHDFDQQPPEFGDDEYGDVGQPGPLKVGDRVIASVTGIADYGVFITTRDGHRGLIHISEISDWFVEDARDYFMIGEEVMAEVISREESTGKYAFSTRRLGGKKPISGDLDYARKLMALHDLERERQTPRPRRAVSRPAADRPVVSTGGAGAEAGGQEQAEIMEFLHQQVGDVSPEAQKEISLLVARYGPVRVALTLAEISRQFDRSLALVNWVARKLEQPGSPGPAREGSAGGSPGSAATEPGF